MTATAQGAFPIEIGDLVGRLAGRAPELARDLLPAGVRRGAEWVVAGADSRLGCSISVHLAGNRAGVWGAWAASKGGDALDLVTELADLARYRHEGDRSDKSAAIRWALDWLRIDPHDRWPTPARPSAAERPHQAEPDAEAKRAGAFRLWLAATPLRPGD